MVAHSSLSPEEPSVTESSRVGFSDRVDAVLADDLIAMLATVTSTGGVIIDPVATVGLRDSAAATVTLTTSLGYWRKLARMARDPRVALLYSDRSNGAGTDRGAVLVQGVADIEEGPDDAFLDDLFDRVMPRSFGAAPSGVVWDRMARVYNRVRVRVTVHAERVTGWEPDGHPFEEWGLPWPATPPDQTPPSTGTSPRVPVDRAASRAAALHVRCLGWVGSDGYPAMVPVTLESADGRIHVSGAVPLPDGERRATVCAHRHGPHLTKIALRHLSGWLDAVDGEGDFAPWTDRGYASPFGMRLGTILGSLQTRVGLRAARRAGVVRGERWVGIGEGAAR